ncbi:alpha/beta-hydrolase [Pluteus cervinus]|uniref:Alpha/beta-hydrolase n=1 Tax=Pluteus cervinus TaxID=181527 RepID=A0ACD3B6B5_9AGAR|nr:alpha/beta-hydrolase [Pluteus cervinus]
MPTATIDEQGSQIYFIDTGPVNGSNNYTTLFMYHGTAFNGATFKKLIPLAPKSNVRLVLVNRRNYLGSTPCSPGDIENIIAGRKAVLEQMALDVAGLLNWFVNHNDIPRISEDGKFGGICILGWSMGIATVLSFFGQPGVVGDSTYTRLAPYIRKLVIYDSPAHALGFDFPPGAYYPFEDGPPEDPKAFAYWADTHYTHPGDVDANDISALDIQSKRGVRSHTDTLSEADWESIVQPESAKNDIGIALFGDMMKLLREQTHRVLFDEQNAKSVIPGLHVVHYVCLATLWSSLYALMQVRSTREGLIEDGKLLRPYEVVKLPDESHFAHWEAPEKFFSALVQAL